MLKFSTDTLDNGRKSTMRKRLVKVMTNSGCIEDQHAFGDGATNIGCGNVDIRTTCKPEVGIRDIRIRKVSIRNVAHREFGKAEVRFSKSGTPDYCVSEICTS